MRLLLFLAAAAIAAGVPLAQQSDTTRNPLAGNAGAAAAGRRLYDQTCQSCHGPAGQGDRGPALNAGTFARGSDDGDLFHVIRAGVSGTQMPPFARLSDEQTWQLVSYLRSLTAPAPAPTAASAAAPPPAIVVRTKDGREIRGVRGNEDTFSVQLIDASGVLHSFDKPTLEAYRVEGAAPRLPRLPGPAAASPSIGW